MLSRIKQYITSQKASQILHPLMSMRCGNVLQFSSEIGIPALSGKYARIHAIRRYQFPKDMHYTYVLLIEDVLKFFLTVAKDQDGVYLAISRELAKTEWNEWFDKDALDFFLTPTSARTLKLHKQATAPAAWSAPRYSKVIDALEGDVAEGKAGQQDQFQREEKLLYTLLVNENGDKAIEIESLPEKKITRIFATLYRPASDIVDIHASQTANGASQNIALVLPAFSYQGNKKSVTQESHTNSQHDIILTDFPDSLTSSAKVKFSLDDDKNSLHEQSTDINGNTSVDLASDVPSASRNLPGFMANTLRQPEESLSNDRLGKNITASPQVIAENPTRPQTVKPDFRRRGIDINAMDMSKVSALPLPSFLLTPKHHKTDLTPHKESPVAQTTEAIRCDRVTAKSLLDEATRRSMSICDVVREMLGLHVQMRDEVMFEISLSEADYKTLAQRYQIPMNKRDEIRARMLDDLSEKISRPSH